MSLPNSLEDTTPGLSIQPRNFAQEDPGVGGWEWLFNQAEGADAAGIDRLCVSDHVVLGENLEAYADPKAGGTEGGRQPTDSDGQWLDPIVLLSMFAARTKKTRLMTGILIAGLRRPATLAKTLSTLDVLSEGRLDIGVGVGWQREEYEANGASFKGRGVLLDETLEICQTLWREKSAAHHSDTVRFEKIHLNPKPLQPGGIPLWVSGRLNKNVLRRIARFGAGWIPWGRDARDPLAGLARIRETLEQTGRDPKRFQCTSYLPVVMGSDGKLDLEATLAPVGPMTEGGITDLRVTLDLPSEKAAVEDYLSPLVEGFRRAAGRS
jgi:probable F420-dependent oxidoreductase